jgi:hypothetical protein
MTIVKAAHREVKGSADDGECGDVKAAPGSIQGDVAAHKSKRQLDIGIEKKPAFPQDKESVSEGGEQYGGYHPIKGLEQALVERQSQYDVSEEDDAHECQKVRRGCKHIP